MATPRMVRALPRGNWLDDSGDQFSRRAGFLSLATPEPRKSHGSRRLDCGEG